MAVVKSKIKDGFVSLYLNGELKLEQAEVSGVNIGTYIDYEDEEVAKCDYDTALVGRDASFATIEVYADGKVEIDEGGRIANINITGGTLTGSPICVGASGWYGAGICLSSADYTQDGPGAVLLTGGTFSGCAVNPLNGYTGHGGAIETYGGTLSAQNSFFTGNSANGTGAAGGAMALMFSNNTITGGTFSANKAYFGGAIQQNGGAMTVTGAIFAGNSTEGDPTDTYAPGGGAVEIHNGATASISGSTFSANSSRSGGAIYNDTYNTAKSTATVDGCVFDANTADYQGGAIYNFAALTVTNSVFTGNTVTDPNPYSYTSFGGAVANTKNGTMTITGGTFSANSAVQGGAIATFIDYGSSDTANLTVTDSAFSGNTTAYGGGIYIQTSTADMTTVSGTDFSGNTASYGGGAICECFGALSVTGGTFTANSAGNDGGAIAVWDSGNTAGQVSGATFDANTALYGGAISHSWASAALTISDCMFIGNSAVYVPDDSVQSDDPAPVPTAQGGAVWNDANSMGVVTISGSTFSGNTAEQGGAVYNAGNMKLENVVLATATDTVYNSGSLAFAGVNTLGASVVNDGKITFSLGLGYDPLVSDLGAFSGSGTYLMKCSSPLDGGPAIATFAATAGTFTGSLSVKLDNKDLSDVFTLKDGKLGNDIALIGNGMLMLRLQESDTGVLTVVHQLLLNDVPAVSKDGSIIAWRGASETKSWTEIAQGDSFDNAIRIATDGTAFDVVSAPGAYSCQVTEAGSEFAKDSASWSSAESAPRQVASNGNGRADIFFATVSDSDKWTARYQAKNTVTGETASITGKNRIRDTFTGSDANILYLSDTANGDALFMDDIYSEFGDAARLNAIREVRAGAGDDVVDMTTERYAGIPGVSVARMTVRGGAGDDVIWGAAYNQKLFGDAGNDWIVGSAVDDVIVGGAGDDTLAGGGGNDTFTFGGNWGSDVVSQAATGTVTLWFESGSLANWDEATLTYTDGTNSVVVSGVAADKIALKFGDDSSVLFDELV
ncbi:MAG: hypothetical protein IKC53_02415, partial [Lentisphaeria bacterium]|nr:hypothetical protein [Lentisphaeria bacterium]